MPYLTVPELAERWHRTDEWVRGAARAKQIPSLKIGHQWRFDLTEIEAYEDSHRRRDPMSLTPAAARRLGARR